MTQNQETEYNEYMLYKQFKNVCAEIWHDLKNRNFAVPISYIIGALVIAVTAILTALNLFSSMLNPTKPVISENQVFDNSPNDGTNSPQIYAPDNYGIIATNNKGTITQNINDPNSQPIFKIGEQNDFGLQNDKYEMDFALTPISKQNGTLGVEVDTDDNIIVESITLVNYNGHEEGSGLDSLLSGNNSWTNLYTNVPAINLKLEIIFNKPPTISPIIKILSAPD